MAAKLKTVARLTVVNAPSMTKERRKDIADWLRKQAARLVRSGTHYTEGRYRARYHCQ